MREILFRGKTDNGEWKEGDVFQVFDDGFFIHDRRCHSVKVIPETIGQYTGLNDKNGTKIFEGDILEVDVYEYETETYSFNVFSEIVGRRYKKQTGKKIKALWSVEYKEHYCRGNGFYAYGKDRRFNVSLKKSTLFNANAEVIGNIHDNPEMLGGEQRKEDEGRGGNNDNL